MFIQWVKKLFRQKQYDLYLAGPMKSYPNGNKELFLKAAKWLRAQGYTVWNPAEQNDGNKNFHDCIKKDLIAIIHQCNGIVLLSGWKNSLGANAEAFVAYVCGKPAQYIYQSLYGNFYLADIDLEKMIVLPFNPEKREYRKRTEMIIAENKIFDSIQ